MDKLNESGRPNPYEALRTDFFTAITREARIIRKVRSWKARKKYLDDIIKLAKTIDANDICTRGHCSKVMKYSLMISRRLDLPQKEIKLIKIASILHDIGKIGIDLSILRKPGRLTEADWEKVRMHPDMGATIAHESGFLDKVAPIIKHHHARYSGGGYPDPNKREDDIPVGSRIIAVADAYDAMTSDRPYRKAMSREDALEELDRCSGKQFDPQIVNAFLSVN